MFWEDDPVQILDPWYEGGANKSSLVQAQANYVASGAMESRFVGSVTGSSQVTFAIASGARWQITTGALLAFRAICRRVSMATLVSGTAGNGIRHNKSLRDPLVRNPNRTPFTVDLLKHDRGA